MLLLGLLVAHWMTADADPEMEPDGGENDFARFGKIRFIQTIRSTFAMTVATKRTIALCLFFVSSAAFGIADLLLYANPDWSMTGLWLHTFIGIVTIVAWCRFDSVIQGYPLTTGLAVIIMLLAIVGVPVYLVRSRGWAGAAKLGFGLPIYLLALGLYHGCWHATFWIADQAGYFG